MAQCVCPSQLRATALCGDEPPLRSSCKQHKRVSTDDTQASLRYQTITSAGLEVIKHHEYSDYCSRNAANP